MAGDFRVDDLRAALRGAGVDVWEWDIDSDVMADEDIGFSQLGYAPGEIALTQVAWSQLIHPEDRTRYDAEYARYRHGKTPMWECVYRIRAKDGSWRHFEERGRYVAWHEDGRPHRMMGTQTDVTERERLRAQAAESALALERSQHQQKLAEAASRAKTEFLSRISHELRTPLNAVLGFTQLMQVDQRDPPSEGQRQRLKLVLESGTHLLQMINDLLDLSRAETGELGLRLAPVPLAPLAQECLAMLQPTADAAGVALLPALDAAPTVMADATRLRQVLLNLLGNAIKYNRAGGQVLLGAAAQGGQGVIEVRDSGVGIAADELAHIFEPFFRSLGAQATREGSGIGLAVTRSLVLAMGGRIDVESTPGQGSSFRVWLPLADAAGA